MKRILLQDIVIPAGTVFTEAPAVTQRFGNGHIQTIIGLSPNTSGDFTYSLDPECVEEMQEWFKEEE